MTNAKQVGVRRRAPRFFIDVPGFPLPPVEPGVSVAGVGPVITVCIAGECRDTTLGGQPGPWIVPDDRLGRNMRPWPVMTTARSGVSRRAVNQAAMA